MPSTDTSTDQAGHLVTVQMNRNLRCLRVYNPRSAFGSGEIDFKVNGSAASSVKPHIY